MNFILINPDEMRHDAAGCYGNGAAVTPHIDRLARDGTLFENCFVQHPVCTPSRASFLTGLYPHNRGHRTLWNPLGAEEPNLFSYLKQNGYDVHIWGKNDALDPLALEKSATTVNYRCDAKNAGNGSASRYPYGTPGYYSFLYENRYESYTQHPDYRYVQGAIDFLDAKPQTPFCLFLPIGLPHCPYWVTKDFADRIDLEKCPQLKPYVQQGKPDLYRLIREYRELDKLDPEVFREIMRVYLAMASMADQMTGDLLDAVSRNGLDDDTCILFFSDHGDWAGDYGLVEKWPSGLDDCLTHVPLIIRAPGYAKGQRVKAPVELFDVFATVLDLAGVQPEHTHFARSLTPQLHGQEGDLGRTVFAEGGYDPHEPHCFEGTRLSGDIPEDPRGIYYPKGRMQQDSPASVCRAVMARTLTHKLVLRSDGHSELYDLAKDPDELCNVYGDPEYEPVRGDLEGRLLRWYLKTSDTVPHRRKDRGFDRDVTERLNAAYAHRQPV